MNGIRVALRMRGQFDGPFTDLAMRLQHSINKGLLGLGGSLTLRFLRSTIDWRALYFDPSIDPMNPQYRGRFVYAGWHEYMVMPIALRGSRKLVALASQHGDGQFIARAMKHLNWHVVCGSSSRGGSKALLQMLRDDARSPNITPDGPRGPRRHFSAGALFLASKLQLPLVCAGYGYRNPWRMRSWDSFAVPKPWSQGRAVFGPPMQVPARLDRTQFEEYRQWFERLLNWLTSTAEAWAADGRRRHGEILLYADRAASSIRKWTPDWSPQLPWELERSWPAHEQVTPLRRVA